MHPAPRAFSSCCEMAGVIHSFIPLAFEINNSAPKRNFSIFSTEFINPPSPALSPVKMEPLHGGDEERGGLRREGHGTSGDRA